MHRIVKDLAEATPFRRALVPFFRRVNPGNIAIHYCPAIRHMESRACGMPVRVSVKDLISFAAQRFGGTERFRRRESDEIAR